MNNDIVTRLREKYAGQLPICTEAADEIERLEERLDVVLERMQGFITENQKLKRVIKGLL